MKQLRYQDPGPSRTFTGLSPGTYSFGLGYFAFGAFSNGVTITALVF
jgi:hypothetical protein